MGIRTHHFNDRFMFFVLDKFKKFSFSPVVMYILLKLIGHCQEE